ncbi:recombinase family protein [Microbacterium algeriense]|uniref:Dehydrogenase n=1 Tax=Microbacterium algeriense TaxID=2615184 RepID=A0ABQ6V3K4_9MICO|nr:recombinase family protein [Microbacterium algeriense]KAB1862504.1 dehydrogenase [Microbacterium algeriense]
MSETIEPVARNAGDETLTSPLHLPHAAAECPKCFTELQENRNFWLARPDGSRLVGLVVSRDDMPSIVEQRADLTRFGVPIEGFRHPAPDILESWSDRLSRLINTLNPGDVLVVATIAALGRNSEEGARTVAELRRHGIIVKVLNHNARHLADAAAAVH